jgi:hypothetical protein
MADLPPTDPRGTVIFGPLVDRLPRETARRIFSRLAMTDYGDYVEWTDGKRTTRMRLPDQPDTGAGYPVLDAVLIATYSTAASYTPRLATEDRIRFLDPDGVVIAWLGPRAATSTLVSQQMLPQPQAYQPLVARGVKIINDEVHSDRAMLDKYPDPYFTGRRLAYKRHEMAFIMLGGLILAAIILAIVYALGR